MSRFAAGFSATLALTDFVCPAGAQTSAGRSTESISTPPPPRYQPYTAEFRITHVHTLADGTAITSEGTEIRARNSEGITMQSNTNQDWQLGRFLGTNGAVHDTDGTILANWYSVTNIGRIFKMPPKEERHGCWMSDNLRMDWDGPRTAQPPTYVFNPATRAVEQIQAPVQRSAPQVANLGTSMIQGAEAHGRRTTRTIAVGEAGNDRTVVTVEENWFAPTLGLEVLQTVKDPRIGKRTRELVNLTLGEPDPSLFQPPADYNVTTEEMHPVDCKQ